MARDLVTSTVGSLVGAAAGDCLGVGVEGKWPDEIAARYGQVRDFRYDPAVWSDDTQQALVLVEATIRGGVPDPEWVGHRYVEMRDAPGGFFGVHRGTGRGFRHAVDGFATTGDWRSSARTDRVGNGAAMRIAPVGVALRDLDDEAFIRAIAEVSILTHREIRSVSAALAVARIAAELSRLPAYPLQDDVALSLFRDAVRWVADAETWAARTYGDLLGDPAATHAFSETLGKLAEDWGLGRGLDELIRWVAEMTSERMGEPRLATDGYALASVTTAIVLALRSAGFEEALVRTVNLGGDADTTAAMVGGMAGAAGGPEAIPDRWKTFAGYEELEAWARRLAGVGATEDLPDLLELERRLMPIVRG